MAAVQRWSSTTRRLAQAYDQNGSDHRLRDEHDRALDRRVRRRRDELADYRHQTGTRPGNTSISATALKLAGDEIGKPTVAFIVTGSRTLRPVRGHPATGPSIGHGRDSEASECSAVFSGSSIEQIWW